MVDGENQIFTGRSEESNIKHIASKATWPNSLPYSFAPAPEIVDIMVAYSINGEQDGWPSIAHGDQKCVSQYRSLCSAWKTS